jgi:hypothetical protein
MGHDALLNLQQHSNSPAPAVKFVEKSNTKKLATLAQIC